MEYEITLHKHLPVLLWHCSWKPFFISQEHCLQFGKLPYHPLGHICIAVLRSQLGPLSPLLHVHLYPKVQY